MRIALVWPYGNDITYSLPLGIGYLIASTDTSIHEIKVFDGTLDNADADSPLFEQFLADFQPEVLGVSCWSKTFKQSVRVLRKTKATLPQCTTVMGGIHPTAYPEKSLEDLAVDYLLTGECERSFPLFLERMTEQKPLHDVPGIVMRTPEGLHKCPMDRITDLDSIPFPDYRSIRLNDYIDKGYRYFSRKRMNAPIWLTRGCPYHCKFCTAPVINGTKLRMHSADYAVKWIKMLYNEFGIRHINIIDDNFTFHSEYTRTFCNAILKENLEGLELSTANGIRAQRTDFETLKLMKMAGWHMVTVAPESGSPSVLKLMRKSLDPSIWPRKVREIHAAGLRCHAAILIGYPGEMPEDIALTEKLIRSANFDSIGIQYFQPLPGTPIYDDLVNAGEIDDELLPNTTTEQRVYVTQGLRDFDFARFAFRMYLFNFLRSPMGTLSEIMLFPPSLIVRRLCYLIRDALFGIGNAVQGRKPSSDPAPSK